MEGFTLLNLEALQVDAMLLVESHVSLGKISSHNAHQFHRREEAGRHCRMAGGAAQQARVFCVRRFDGIEFSAADNENAHAIDLRLLLAWMLIQKPRTVSGL